jgi:membrane protease YdiL (CAAX protease family)
VIAIVGTVAKGSDEVVVAEGASLNFLSALFVVASISIGIWFVRTGYGKLPRKGYLDPAITPVMAIILFSAMLLFGIIGGIIGGWWGGTRVDGDSMQQLAWMHSGAMLAPIPIVIAYAALRRRCGSRHIVPSSIIAFFVFVPMTFAAMEIGHIVFSYVGIEPPGDIAHVTLMKLADEPWGWSAFVVVLCATIGAGIVEEVMYRGLILPSLSTIIGGNTVWKAIIITSILFSVMHWDSVQPSALLGLFVFSIGLCWARVKSGGVVAPIAMHILFNAINIAYVYYTQA